MTKNLIEDLSSLTNVSENNLKSILDIIKDIICNDVLEVMNTNDNMLELDINIGTLFIKVLDDSVEYKFIPSKNLEKNILNTIEKKQSPLIKNLEKSLVRKIENTYKNYF